MEEIVTITSEDLGFKALGSKVILPAFIDEKLPLSSLNDFQINNELNLFVATCGGESHQLIIGNLQELRDYVVSEKANITIPTSFTTIDDINDNIIAINILPNIEKIVVVTLHGQLIYIDTKNTSSKQTKQINENITILKTSIINDTLYYIDSTHSLCSFNLNQDTNQSLLSGNVADFDKCINGDKMVILTMEDNKLQFYSIKNDTFNLDSEFPHPEDIVNAIEEEVECDPLNVTTLYNNQYLIVIGNSPSEDEEDIMYDHKTYIMKLDANNKPTYHESFDIAPAFGSVKRAPSIYNITLPNIVDGVSNYNIITSSCSTEVSIWDSNEVVQPDQDGERAVLPVSQETDNDTCPIGMALDYSTVGIIPEPCSGVDKIDKLPLIYLLNNEGLLQIWGFYHSHAIKANAYHIDNVANFYLGGGSTVTATQPNTSDAQTIVSTQTDQSSVFTKSDDQATIPTTNEPAPAEDDMTSSLGGLTFSQSNNDEPSKPAFSFGQSNNNETSKQGFSFGASGSGTSTDSPFKIPENKTSTTTPVFGSIGFGQPADGTTSAFSSSAFGNPAFGQTEAGKPAFGQSTFGQSTFGQTENAANTPAFGQSTFGKPAFGQSAFGQTPDATSSSETTKPLFGQNTFGQNAVATASSEPSKPLFGQAGFGQDLTSSSSNERNKPAFGQATFGQTSFGQTSFGQTSFGQTSSDTNQEPSTESAASTTSTFGQGSAFSAFGNLSKGESPFDKLKKGDSPFDKLKNGDSPFANLEKAKSPFAKFGKTPENTVDEELDFRQDDENKNETEVQKEDDVSDSEEGSEGNESLSDSTVEQTPFISSDSNTNNKFSISSFTDSLKKTANISTSNLANISTSNFANTTFGKTNNAEKGASPFASFANNLNKSETPSFSLSNLNIDKEEDEEDESETPEVKIEEPKAEAEEPEAEEPEAEEPEAAELEAEEPEAEEPEAEEPEAEEPEAEEPEAEEPEAEEPEAEEPEAEEPETEEPETEEPENMIDIKETESSMESSQEPSEIIETPLDEDREESQEEVSETESLEGNEDTSGEEILSENQSRDGATELEKTQLVDVSVDSSIKTVDQKIQTEPVEYVSAGIQVKEYKSQTSQTEPIQYNTFQMQSFENDENYLAEFYMPKPLGKYYTNAQVSNIPHISNDKTMRLFESTYQQIEAEFIVLEDNLQVIKEFLEDQTTINLEERTESSLGNKYAWRIPEVKRLFDIIQKRQTNVDKFSNEINELDVKISNYKKEDLATVLYEKNKAKQQYTQMDYLRTEILNNKFAPLSSHQNEMKKLLRDKMSSLDKRSEEIKTCLFVSKSLVNYLKDPINTDIKLLLMSADFFDASDKFKPKPITFGLNKLVTQEQIESLDVVQAGLNINAKKQVGEFFKQINSKKF